jgi:L-erythro-3,5-diaminohexanoate dehydrogenase
MSDRVSGSPLGLHRVLDPPGVLPQAAWRLDPSPVIWPDEVLVRVQRLNLDAASFRQLKEASGGDPAKLKAAVLEIVGSRGKMHNPVTGSGGMLTGTVAEAGPSSPLGLKPGDQIATLVSLSLTPLEITDGLAGWDGQSEQVPCQGHAVLFGRSIAAPLPDDLPATLALAVLDVCGAPALTSRVVAQAASRLAGEDRAPVVAILGAAGKSGSLAAAAARRAGAGHIIGVVPDQAEACLLAATMTTARPDVLAGPGHLATGSGHLAAGSGNEAAGASHQAGGAGHPVGGPVGLADEVVVTDARDPVALAAAVRAAGGPADVTVVCVDVPGCEGGAILATADGGTVIFFSMATSFTAAALGAEGAAADVTMLVGNGFVPGHARLALDLIRAEPGVRALFERRISGHGTEPGKDGDGHG